ncbi:hypothetical protein chiPu_0010949 [Chiloscyllium punctatum]|uniref:Uncharacterized protein n=1 Tax=Chiloscyllium punctatum TaxID=137246 RepID=A0A401SQ38_CHIPU|nr:hypothetical protein [Chiloscyllium punctatum]
MAALAGRLRPILWRWRRHWPESRLFSTTIQRYIHPSLCSTSRCVEKTMFVIPSGPWFATGYSARKGVVGFRNDVPSYLARIQVPV